MKVTCSVCDESGEINRNERKGGDWVAICEFCYLNLTPEDTLDGHNKFYMES